MATQSAFNAAAAAAHASSAQEEAPSTTERVLTNCVLAAKSGMFVGVFIGVVVLVAGALGAAGNAITTSSSES